METTEAGDSRTREILDPAFLEGLDRLAAEEVRQRRDRALAEREFQSYLRRLIQVRQDILSAERGRRARGEEPQPLMERLTAALSAGPQGPGRGEAPRFALSDDDLALAEQRATDMLGHAASASPESLSDQDLDKALVLIDREERVVSAERAGVLRVHDRLQDELKRRFREDRSEILRNR